MLAPTKVINACVRLMHMQNVSWNVVHEQNKCIRSSLGASSLDQSEDQS